MHENEILISRMVKFIKPRTYSKLFKRLYKSKTKKNSGKEYIYTKHMHLMLHKGILWFNRETVTDRML